MVQLPIIGETPPILFDIDFDTVNPNLGWIVGNRGTFLQTKDAGKSWCARTAPRGHDILRETVTAYSTRKAKPFKARNATGEVRRSLDK